jgi:hypothetical protein
MEMILSKHVARTEVLENTDSLNTKRKETTWKT